MHRTTDRFMEGRQTARLPAWRRLIRHPLLQRMRHELLQAPLESILHASRKRLQWLGGASLIGQPLFYWIWAVWLPQPYDNLGVRCAVGLLGGLLMLNALANHPTSSRTEHAFNAICFIQLPLFFS